MGTLDKATQASAYASRTAPLKIHALTSARFFAALYVVFFHTHWGVTSGSFLSQILALGYISPYFFFTLSGYILSVVYLRSEQPVDSRRFFVARFARIYPLYFVSLLLTFPFAVAGRVAKYGLMIATGRVAVQLAQSSLMMQMWSPVPKTLNQPSWTIAIEAVFYLSFPWIGPLLWKLGSRAAGIAMIVIYVGGVALYWLVAGLSSGFPPVCYLGSFMTVFAAGILLAKWQAIQQQKPKTYDQGHTRQWALIAIAALAFFTAVFTQRWLKGKNLDPAFLLLPVYLTVIWTLTGRRNYAIQWLNVKWLVVLGEASYALYLLQNPIVNALESLHLTGSPWHYPLYLGVCIGLSVLSFYFFETPCRRWILHKLHSPTKETIEAASSAQ